MAFYINWAESLLQTRAWLEDVNAQINDPGNYQKMIGFLNFLSSDINPKVIDTEMMRNAGNSEYRPVQVRYIPHKGTGNLITDNASSTCTKVAQRRDKLQLLQPTLYAEDKFTIEENYVRENAEGASGKLQSRLNREIRDCMRVVRESIDAQLFAKAAGLFGANPAVGGGAGSYYDIPVIIGSSGKIDDRNFDVIKNQQEDNLMGGVVSLIGSGNARRYMNRLAVGNANDAGIDYREVASEFGMLLWKDSHTLASLSDANRVLAIYPGMTQMYHYNLYTGSDFVQPIGDIAVKGTLPDPVIPGLTYDYQLRYDDNCSTGNGQQGAWIGRVWAYFDLWTVPEDAFGDVYGPLNDFNGILGYRFTES